MFEKLCAHILPRLIPPNSKILVAVSGGPDSMALSHILWRYCLEEPQNKISLVLTHVHHGVRKESDDEEKMVQKAAAEWGLPCLIHRFNAKMYAKAVGQSFETAAREWRYARWREDMAKEGCNLLATAHHLGDQAETILYRLLRGSGTAGLAGIYPFKGSIIRPLLTFSKGDILKYCAKEDLPYALDQSNQEPVYVRNRIRLELLPELEKKYNPRIQETLGRTGELLRWDEDYITRHVEAAWGKYYCEDVNGRVGLKHNIFDEPAAILSRLIRKAAMLVNHEPRGLGFGYVIKIMESQGKKDWVQNLPGITVQISEEGVWFSNADSVEHSSRLKKLEKQQAAGVTFIDFVLDIGRCYKLEDLKLEIGLYEESDYLAGSECLTEQINKVAVFSKDCLNRLQEKPVCRTRRQGDKMWFRGVGHKTIKKVFQEENIPVELRNQLLLIACGDEVLWIPGVRQGDFCRLVEDEDRVYGVVKPLA